MPARLIAFISLLALAVLPATAQPLTDKIPDDAMLYVGWKGTSNLGDAYQQSHLKAVYEASDAHKLFDTLLPQLADKLGKSEPEAGEAVRLVQTLGGALAKYESAVYFGGLIMGNNAPPSPKVAILVRAGADSQSVLKQINDILAKAGNDIPFKIEATAYGDLVAVTTGRWPAFDALLGGPAGVAPAPALKTNPKFTAALAQAGKDPVVTLYVDVDAILKMIDGFVAMAARPNDVKTWAKVERILGLRGLKQTVVTAGFNGKSWVSDCFVGAPSPRPGLLSIFGAANLDDDTLNLIPKDAVMAWAAYADFGAGLAAARKSVNASDAQVAQQADAFIQQASQFIGLDIEKDLLAPLGPGWAAYVSPDTGGQSVLGFVLVNKLRDPATAVASFKRLETKVNDLIAQAISNPDITVKVKTQTTDDIELHYVALPVVTPTYAIVDDKLYFALYPQPVVTAVHNARTKVPSILQNEKFTAARKRLGVPVAGSITFSDLQRTAPQSYGTWMLITRYIGFADIFGLDSPAMMIPPIHKLMPELEPAAAASWVDDLGYHCRDITPFPGAGVVAGDPLATLGVAQPAIMASILLPSLNRARETANRVKSASNLRQIGVGMLLYANENRGKYPPTLGDVIATQDIGVEVFTSPGGGVTPPHGIVDKQKLAEWVNENADYVYMGAGKTSSSSPEDIVAYEKPETRGMDGMNILFADGHVDFCQYQHGMELIHQQQEKDAAHKK